MPSPLSPTLEERQRALQILDRILAHVHGRTMLGQIVTEIQQGDEVPKMKDSGKGTPALDPTKRPYTDFEAVTGKDAFRVLISTVLSVRNRDEATLVATESLFAALPTPDAIRDAPREQVEQLVRRSGMYKTKAARIQEIAQIILDQYGGAVPRDLDTLMTLPGVGRKVANCVMVYAYAEPAIPVDTHVHRIANRTGLATTKKPEQTEEVLRALYPKERWLDVNEAFVLHGQQTCKPIGPLCPQCPVEDICPKRIEKSPQKRKRKSKPMVKDD
jgi:endonuclease-3